MKFLIIPFVGFDDISFGMSPAEVHVIMGTEFRSFHRGYADGFPSDYYPNEGVFFYYNDECVLEAVEFGSPSSPNYAGRELLGLPFNKVFSELGKLDDTLKESRDGAISPKLGISLWVPFLKEDAAAPIESVLTFQRGYFDGT